MFAAAAGERAGVVHGRAVSGASADCEWLAVKGEKLVNGQDVDNLVEKVKFGRAVAVLGQQVQQTIAVPRLHRHKWWWQAGEKFLEELTLEQVVDLVKREHPQLPRLYLVGRHVEAVDFARAHKLNPDQVVSLTYSESLRRLRGYRDCTLILLGDDGEQYRGNVGAIYFLFEQRWMR